MQTFIEKLEIVRHLCSEPKKGSRGRKALKGIAPEGHIIQVGLSLEEVVRWVGANTPLTDDMLSAVEALMGAQRATFGKLIWASHKIERAAFETEVANLDKGYPRKGKPVSKLRDGELKREVISRRIGLLRKIEKLGGRADSGMTAAKLLNELRRVNARKAEGDRSRKLAEANRKSLQRFSVAKSKGLFTGSFSEFCKAEERRRTEEAENCQQVGVKLDLSGISLN